MQIFDPTHLNSSSLHCLGLPAHYQLRSAAVTPSRFNIVLIIFMQSKNYHIQGEAKKYPTKYFCNFLSNRLNLKAKIFPTYLVILWAFIIIMMMMMITTTTITIIIIRLLRQRNRRIWFCKMGNAQMEEHWSNGPEVSQWPGMQLSQTVIQNHTLATLPLRQSSGETGSQWCKRNLPSMMNWPVHTPASIETGGTWNHWDVELVQEIGRQATLITGKPGESNFQFQQLSTALQKGKCSCLPQHLWLQLDAAAVISYLV